MDEGDNTRLEDFFLQFILENSKELEDIIEVKFDGFWNIKQESDEVLQAQGTGDDGENDINIYLNIGGDDKRFVGKIQDLIARAGEGEENFIICIAKEFSSADIEELMQDVVFYLEKCIHLIFLTVNIEESDENEKINIKQEVGIRVYKNTY